jgi:hypothetical protein
MRGLVGAGTVELGSFLTGVLGRAFACPDACSRSHVSNFLGHTFMPATSECIVRLGMAAANSRRAVQPLSDACACVPVSV